ncbi:polypeptide N-acetylgalactosaminyltransferase 11-like [Biomphalaria glabrata]|uniref:Polypeptide N-acetylgalactosaminyltransferase 11-like n=1 Tax=Biomphalaria glabrata TaxID=6526 RepID=A0A9W2Z2G1_BIOGL|nr:polypeptide N-acetylgalactosaminyltransferase 11-like [Biomphalaria glabrata]XP_055869157.1 polypeptide N-acetylgalactosaminyltransferase 11-like [Biomphalaria glabrata]XP_055869158.1 polypeptide N-acetylgalactosaminyltransferase 11-like [Biomphalaria glabrata]XP_055869159.1 polypeptide N-acetylgalactosaminyltransferase 11-like [Biomphalaria glabrata]XP_055869160.1 polypeptide N-acetylgalactosaminyltransferase 11-like [Biomphalaria glabrata]XP_055869161.1 polypeptide N-acetylgalactosaminylt
MKGSPSGPVYTFVHSLMFKEIPKVHCRRRKRKAWLTTLCLGFVSLAYGLLYLVFTRCSDSIQFAALSTAEIQSIQLMVLKIQNTLQKDNSTTFDSARSVNHEEYIERVAAPCRLEKQRVTLSSTSNITLIYSLLKGSSSRLALFYLNQTFASLSLDIITDIIIIADESLQEKEKGLIEDVVDCDVCRVFFLSGTIHEQRNFASNFARGEYLVFLDGRVHVHEEWLHHLMAALNDSNNRVVSPALQLTSLDGSLHTVGLTVNELQWDLSVARARADEKRIQSALLNRVTYVSQTAITPEVFLLSKELFNAMGQFDTRQNLSGSEDVMFSLKLLSCGGEVVVSMCSSAYLRGSTEDSVPTANQITSYEVLREDYFSRLYNEAVASIFLDSFTLKYYSCVNHLLNLTTYHPQLSTASPFSRNRGLILNPGRMKTQLEQHVLSKLKLLKCRTKNFKTILSSLQPAMVAPTKFATFYGYIRTLDGVWALGLHAGSEKAISASQTSLSTTLEDKIVLTRNASLWVGPFSFTNGAFIFQHKWCLTSLSSDLFSLTRCVVGTTGQLFIYNDNIIRLASQHERSVCAVLNGNYSNPIFLNSCKEQNFTNKFKLDLQFRKDCIQ